MKFLKMDYQSFYVIVPNFIFFVALKNEKFLVDLRADKKLKLVLVGIQIFST